MLWYYLNQCLKKFGLLLLLLIGWEVDFAPEPVSVSAIEETDFVVAHVDYNSQH